MFIYCKFDVRFTIYFLHQCVTDFQPIILGGQSIFLFMILFQQDLGMHDLQRDKLYIVCQIIRYGNKKF